MTSLFLFEAKVTLLSLEILANLHHGIIQLQLTSAFLNELCPFFFRIVISFHAHFEFLALLFFLERKIWIAAVFFFFFFCGSVVIVSKGQFCSLDSFSRPKNLRENNLSVQTADWVQNAD